MRGFFNSWRFRIIAMVLLVILGLMLRAAMTDGFATLPQNIISVIVTPVEKLSSQLSGTVTDFLASFTTYSEVKKENEKLTSEVQQLNSKLVNYDNVMLQNQQYKDFLGIKQENNDYKFEPAMVISRDPGQWFSSFTIDKGSMDGMQPKDPVITADGVVGIISQVMLTSSVVTTILDPSSQVGVIISRTGDVCISEGSRELLEKGQLKIVYIPRDSNISKGDIIITSGIGGIFPKGLKIATVQDFKIDTDGMSLYAITQPMVNPSKVKNVFVITDFKGKASDIASQGGGK